MLKPKIEFFYCSLCAKDDVAENHKCHDPLNPSHYKSEKMEAIDVIESFGLNFHLGNSIKYILRAGKKENKILCTGIERRFATGSGDRGIVILFSGQKFEYLFDPNPHTIPAYNKNQEALYSAALEGWYRTKEDERQIIKFQFNKETICMTLQYQSQ